MTVTIRRVALITFAVVVLWLAVGAWQAVSAAADLRLAQTHARDGRELAASGEVGEAVEELHASASAFNAAHRRLTGVAVLPWRLVPPAGRNLRVLADLSAAGARTARAGEVVTAALDALPGGLDALAPRDGALPVSAYSALDEPLRQAHGLLAAAVRDVERTRGIPVASRVDAARRTLAEIVEPAADAAGRGAALTRVLPRFLGADTPRRYLFVAQNPAELRGTGGFIGAFSILTLDEGGMRFRQFGEIHDLPAYHWSEVPAPSPEFARRYNRYGGAGFWHNINMTPDFPTAARAMETLYEKGSGDDIDGVVAADPFAFQALLQVTGDVRVPGFGRVPADEVVDVVSNRAHAELANSAVRKRLLGAVAIGAFQGLLREGGEPLRVAGALADAAGDGHLLLWSEDPEVQAAFLRSGLAGALPRTDGDFLAVVANAGSAAKLDYYIDRTVRYDVDLARDGSLEARTSVTFANTAPPRGVSRRVIGPNADGLAAGEQRLVVALYAAEGTRAQDFVRTSGERPMEIDEELGHPVFTTVVEVASRTRERLALTWERPGAWAGDEDRGRYRLTVHNQPTLRPTIFEVTVRLPPEMTADELPDGVERLDDGRLLYRTAEPGDFDLDVAFASTHRPSLWARVSDWLSRPLIEF